MYYSGPCILPEARWALQKFGQGGCDDTMSCDSVSSHQGRHRKLCSSKCQGAGYLKHPDAAYTFAFSRSSLLFWHYSCSSFHRSPFLNFFLVEHRKFTFLGHHIMSCHYWSHHNFPSEIRFIFAKQIRPLRLGSSVFCGACGHRSPRWHLWEIPMAEVAESWEDLCPKKKGRKPKKSHSRCKKMDFFVWVLEVVVQHERYMNSQDCLQDVYDRSCWRMYINGRNLF